MTIPWLDILRAALDSEFHARNPIAALATVDSAGLPHVRSLICRKLAPDGTLAFTTDARSEKMHHLRHQSHVELLFWLPTWREQYRLAGLLTPIPGTPRTQAWRDLSPMNRSLFAWPPPGQPLDPSAPFPHDLPPETPVPDNFVLLHLAPTQVEQLELSDHPHRRRRWKKANGWKEEAINP